MKCIILFALLLHLASCSEKRGQKQIYISPQQLKLDSLSLVELKRNSHLIIHDSSYVFDLLLIGDTLIAVKGHGGLSISTNAGKQWQTIHADDSRSDYVEFDNITVDANKVLWGLKCFERIHVGPIGAKLMYSYDLGVSWVELALTDTHFIPMSIFSEPGKPLELITHEGNVFELQSLAQRKWKLIEHLPDLDYKYLNTHFNEERLLEDYNDSKYKFLDNGDILKKDKAKWNRVTSIYFVDRISSVCECNRSLYITARKEAISPSPFYLLRIDEGQVRHIIITPYPDSGIRCDRKGKLWLFNSYGVWEVIWDTALKKRL
ncbi:hypothetical protein LRS06_20145 [Hymenobacter sp. J193]|uniref:WD40/YVTN/BNR-like repeat-containing protein n=1 Tax=Hymenobacter sp. J193 TaxID=2898429 RepID=UPI002151BC6A|nr:hypothetical protein [Hymenobacter sp. J193]MCR5890042.1 hypothetical protein [Hymenobacter sp. J193]